jgi:molybdopterin synthase catalytic subunit
VRDTWLTRQPIDPSAILAQVGGPEDGAAVLFIGTVRAENDGRPVNGMRYEAYQTMAERELAAIVSAVRERTGVARVVAVHRTGELEVGEVSVAVAASAPHRSAAFEAARDVIEEIKRRLPVWKHEHYTTGEARWLDGVEPPVKSEST